MASSRPVGALDQHVGLKRRDDVVRRVLVEDDDARRRAASAARISARSASGVIGPIRTLVRPHRSIRVDADDERVAEAARVLQVANVPGMQEVEDAVGEDDASCPAAREPGPRSQRLPAACRNSRRVA